MAVVYSKVLLFDPPLIYTAPDICVFGAVSAINLSGGGRGAMPTVCGTCAGVVVVTVRECVLAIGS